MHQCGCCLVLSLLMLCTSGCGTKSRATTKSARGKTTARAASARKRAGQKQNAGSDSPDSAIKQPAEQPTEQDQTLHPIVVIKTSQGAITLRLDRERAPRTVDAFLSYVESGHYDGTIFHQVLAGQIVLGGGFTSQLEEKRAVGTIPNEANNGLRNRSGTIAMARPLEAVNGATSQFFVNLTDNPQLDHQDMTPDGYGYCVFGEVISGLEVLTQISKVEVRSVDEFELLPVQTVLIESAAQMR